MHVIRRLMDVDHSSKDVFRSRMTQFLVDSTTGRGVTVQIGNEEYPVGVSSQAGLFRGTVRVEHEKLAAALGKDPCPGTWVPYRAVLPKNDLRKFEGTVLLGARHGVSIVSDVDDTIKHSNVPNRRDLFRNTFARVFTPVTGMPKLYQEAASRNVMFHYVSGSPWQLYTPLRAFWESEGYPIGSFHLKRFRFRDTARKIRRSPQMNYKLSSIEPILDSFPERKFILVGDSGEQDPEIYGTLLRSYPHQVKGAFIRAVHGADPASPRFDEAFHDLPKDVWHVFRSPSEVHDTLLGLVGNLQAGIAASMTSTPQ